MSWRLLLVGIAATVAYGAQPGGLSAFYVVSDSSAGAGLYFRVVEVHADGSDSLVRYVRVASMNVYCPRMVVQAAETRVHGVSPAQLVKDNNPCAVKPRDLRTALREYPQKAGILENVSVGIVAQCGSSSVSFGLPVPGNVSLERLRQVHPEVARLWDLASEVTRSAFGAAEMFLDRTEDEDLALQRTGEKLVPELVSGRYDAGLASAVKVGGGRWSSPPSFRSLLGSYGGPVSKTEASTVPQLLNAQAYRFSHFVAPKYPPIALAARVQGKLELRLDVDRATGEVRNVVATSGHPLLQPGGIEAAKQWLFLPNSVEATPVRVTLEFALGCP
ncbi:MAG TPA: energy transducer TonB [Bryobacteraceae bacterium]|jgi:TonB family protein|nr:energy transducer TonB [Bryobacteraceae bacterium]